MKDLDAFLEELSALSNKYGIILEEASGGYYGEITDFYLSVNKIGYEPRYVAKKDSEGEIRIEVESVDRRRNAGVYKQRKE